MRGQKKRKQECNFAASNARVRVAVAPLSLFFSLAPLARLSHLNNNNNNNEKTTPQSKTASSSAADQHAYREFQGRHHATMANHNNINDDAGSEATDMTAGNNRHRVGGGSPVGGGGGGSGNLSSLRSPRPAYAARAAAVAVTGAGTGSIMSQLNANAAAAAGGGVGGSSDGGDAAAHAAPVPQHRLASTSRAPSSNGGIRTILPGHSI